MDHDKYIHGRWTAGFHTTGTGEREVVIGLVLAEDEDGDNELRALGRWIPARDMVPSLGELMDRAIRAPVEGRPHLPAIVRTASAELGEDIQSVRPEVRVEIGPTPVLQEELERTARELATDEHWRWLEAGVDAAGIAALFKAAEPLAEHPWDLEDPGQLLEVELPARGRTCAVLVTSEPSATAVEALSVAIAPSRAALDAWRDDMVPDDEIDVWFYERDDLPDAAWAEAKAHGWRMTDDERYPRVVAGGDAERPPTPDEVALAAAVLEAIGRFKGEGLGVPEQFGGPAKATLVLASGEAATVSSDPDNVLDLGDDEDDDDDGPGDGEAALARWQAEIEEDEAFLALDDTDPWTAAPPPASATVRKEAKPGRNDACWCGSGKKYKKCHLDEDAAKGRA